MQMWTVLHGTIPEEGFKDLVAVVVVGAFGFGGVVRATRGALVSWSHLRSSVWCRDGWTRPGVIVWSRPTPLALVVWLLRVGLALHPPLLHRAVAARVVLPRARRAPRAAGLAARLVPTAIRLVPTSVRVTVRSNALCVASLVIRSWTTVSLLSVRESAPFNWQFPAHVWVWLWAQWVFTFLQLFSVHPHLKMIQRRRLWP